ncbi:hypothetical protein RchiOBHm_Chr3g0473871 [Rosa chinensis]|uniref:Uncharacterized protein n=1 Tax=Rosa chinensis TaxID=74649 RepID=A0A2P6RBZ7_ROSCH|nr:hypothetical protein RchiOBHm_Chr3g0473871 [Rosa chinensis]
MELWRSPERSQSRLRYMCINGCMTNPVEFSKLVEYQQRLCSSKQCQQSFNEDKLHQSSCPHSHPHHIQRLCQMNTS